MSYHLSLDQIFDFPKRGGFTPLRFSTSSWQLLCLDEMLETARTAVTASPGMVTVVRPGDITSEILPTFKWK